MRAFDVHVDFFLAVAGTIPQITHASGVSKLKSNTIPFSGSVFPAFQFLVVGNDTMVNIL